MVEEGFGEDSWPSLSADDGEEQVVAVVALFRRDGASADSSPTSVAVNLEDLALVAGLKFVADGAEEVFDAEFIVEGGDNITASASVLVASAGGAVSDVKTTVLLSVEEGMAAIAQAGEVAGVYSPPS